MHSLCNMYSLQTTSKMLNCEFIDELTIESNKRVPRNDRSLYLKDVRYYCTGEPSMITGHENRA